MSRRATEVSLSNALRERDCNIQEHLRNHVHLTNCIHLKNHVHMQKSKTMSSESSLIRDLILLQRSRSLRDPSTSPSWNSPIGSLMKKIDNKGTGHRAADCSGVKSLVGHLRHEPRGRSGGSSLPQTSNLKREKKANGTRNYCSGRRSRNGVGRKEKGTTDNENQRNIRELTRLAHASEADRCMNDPYDTDGGQRNNAFQDVSLPKPRKMPREKLFQDRSDYTKQILMPSKRDNFESSFHSQFSHGQHVEVDEAYSTSAAEDRGHTTSNVCHRILPPESTKCRKHKSNGIKKPPSFVDSKETPGISVSSNSLIHGASRGKEFSRSQGGSLRIGGEELGVNQTPKNGCGMPWNWSRIHQRGKTILDRAGRSLSCGLSDSANRKMDGLGQHSNFGSHTEPSIVPGTPENSTSLDSDSEALPLLNEPCASQESMDRDIDDAGLSGELGLYADHNFSVREDYVSPSENRSRSCNEHMHVLKKFGYTRFDGRHQSLTEKYVPKTFDELVGQTLVVQALKNAIQKGKIGMVYVFYGPHGTGKTSCARIFAAGLNCFASNTQKPCGSCGACLSEQTGENPHVKEVASVANVTFENISDLVDTLILTSSSSRFHYKVLIVDDCHTLTSEAWKAISKILDQVPQNIVCVLIATSLEQIPHMIITRCQKFFFPKMRDVDVINKLQVIAMKEELEIDKDALKLIASRSDGSLRDAEMTLDQLSLLGQRISLSLVQELVGLIPDEKLIDLLDLALSADTVNTVKFLRELIEAGVEPLSLMSQLATLITDILAGSYVFPDVGRKKFFHKEISPKEKMERLRQALKTLSEAEKQLRSSSDRTTWLTAALLQLAPDHSYVRPSSSTGTSCCQTPLTQNDINERESVQIRSGHQNGYSEKTYKKASARNKDIIRNSNRERGESSALLDGTSRFEIEEDSAIDINNAVIDINNTVRERPLSYFVDINESGGRQFICRSPSKLEEIWERVVDKVNSTTLRTFITAKGKLFSVSFGAVPSAKLIFQTKEEVSIVEKSKSMLSNAFQLALGCPVELHVECVPTGGGNANSLSKAAVPQSNVSNSSKALQRPHPNSPENLLQLGISAPNKVMRGSSEAQGHVVNQTSKVEDSRAGIVECSEGVTPSNNLPVSQRTMKATDQRQMDSAWLHQEQTSPHLSTFGPYRADRHRTVRDHIKKRALVKGKVSLGHVIRHADFDLSQNQISQNSRRKGMSIAEKLEQENLRLESRSGGLLCWRTARVTRKKRKHFRGRMRKSRFLLRLVICAKCPCVKKFR